LQPHPVADGQADESPAHPTGGMGEHQVLIRERDPEHRPRQHRHHYTLDLDRFLTSAHFSIFPLTNFSYRFQGLISLTPISIIPKAFGGIPRLLPRSLQSAFYRTGWPRSVKGDRTGPTKFFSFEAWPSS
jgi:hypothetical protein